jgi:hypothetical protein
LFPPTLPLYPERLFMYKEGCRFKGQTSRTPFRKELGWR